MMVLNKSDLLIHVSSYRKNGARCIVYNHANAKRMQKNN